MWVSYRQKLSLQESNQLIGFEMPTSVFFQKYLVLNPNFQAGSKCPFCLPCPADAHAIIDYFISGSINKASSSNKTKKRFWLIVSIILILASLASNVQYKNIFAMIFNEINCHVNTSSGLVGGCIPCTPPRVRACVQVLCTNKLPLYFRKFSQHEKFDWYFRCRIPSLAQINFKKLAWKMDCVILSNIYVVMNKITNVIVTH